MRMEVEIPDDPDAQLTVLQLVRLLGEGQRVLLLRRPDVPLAEMPVLAARLLQHIKGAEIASRLNALAG